MDRKEIEERYDRVLDFCLNVPECKNCPIEEPCNEMGDLINELINPYQDWWDCKEFIIDKIVEECQNG